MAEIGYGADLSCWGSLSTGRVTSGAELVAQALYRRITTPQGVLGILGGDEESAYGFDIVEYVGAVGDEVAIASLPPRVRAEALKDDRIGSCSVTASLDRTTPNEPSLVVAIEATLSESGEAFALTLSVSDAGAEIIR